MNQKIKVDGPKVFKSAVQTFEIVKVDHLKVLTRSKKFKSLVDSPKIFRLATNNVLPKPRLETKSTKSVAFATDFREFINIYYN